MSDCLEMEFLQQHLREDTTEKNPNVLFGILVVSSTEQVGSALLNYLLPSDELWGVYGSTLWPQTLLNWINFCFQSCET